MSHTADVAELILAGKIEEAWAAHAARWEAACAWEPDDNLTTLDLCMASKILELVSERQR